MLAFRRKISQKSVVPRNTWKIKMSIDEDGGLIIKKYNPNDNNETEDFILFFDKYNVRDLIKFLKSMGMTDVKEPNF